MVGPFGVVDEVERVDLGLQFLERLGERLLVEVAEQGLVEAFVLALGRRFVGLAGDRLDAHGVGPAHAAEEPVGTDRRVDQVGLGHGIAVEVDAAAALLWLRS